MTYKDKIINMMIVGNEEGERLMQELDYSPLSYEERYRFEQKECKTISDFEMDLTTFIAHGE